MKKRAQVSVFVIIGILVLVSFLLIFFFRNKIIQTIRQEPSNPQEYLDQQLNDIKNEFGNCVYKETKEASLLLMSNGGYFDNQDSIHYYGFSYPILCKELNNTNTCLSNPILIVDLQNRLNKYLPEKINKCINLEPFKNKDYVLTSGKLSVDTQILDENIIVNLHIPISLKKDSLVSQVNNVDYKLNVPLGELTRVANDLVQMKAQGKEINTVSYSLLSFNKYLIDVRKPYPDELYNISLINNPGYNFYFGIEGAGKFERPSGRIS